MDAVNQFLDMYAAMIENVVAIKGENGQSTPKLGKDDIVKAMKPLIDIIEGKDGQQLETRNNTPQWFIMHAISLMLDDQIELEVGFEELGFARNMQFLVRGGALGDLVRNIMLFGRSEQERRHNNHL